MGSLGHFTVAEEMLLMEGSYIFSSFERMAF